MMLLRTTAIARLTFREAVRSKLLLSLTTLLVAGLVGLPLLVSGDHTLAGKIQIILAYTTTYATAILSVTTLGLSCGGFSAEIQDRQLYLVLTKPIHRYELWLGKWLGMMGINLALLTLTGLIITLMAHQAIRSSNESLAEKRHVSEQYLLAHQPLAPLKPDWSALMAEGTRRLRQSGHVPESMPDAAIQQKLAEELNIQRFTIPPDGEVHFSFRQPSVGHHGHDLILNYRFDSSRPERTPVAARWTFGHDPGHMQHIDVTNYPGIPVSLVMRTENPTDTNILEVCYQRLDAGNQATLMLADRTQGPELLVPYGSLGLNLVIGLFVILCRLAFLAALGLTAGCLLSTPVALFVAVFVLILMASAGYVESVATSGVFYIPHEGIAPPQNWLDRVILHLFQCFHVVTQPLNKLNPIPLVAAGRLVSWEMAIQAFGWLACLYTAVTALAGIALFNRRELG